MDQATHNKIVSFIWGIRAARLVQAWQVSRAILPMCVLRRMDAVLEPTKQAVLESKRMFREQRRVSKLQIILREIHG